MGENMLFSDSPYYRDARSEFHYDGDGGMTPRYLERLSEHMFEMTRYQLEILKRIKNIEENMKVKIKFNETI